MKSNITVLSLCMLLVTPTHADECEPSTPMFEGTHFKPITEQSEKLGEGLMVTGRILSAKDCSAIVGARIEHWQAGKEGYYKDALRAYSYSKQNGEYWFQTEWPAAPEPHIHFTVSAQGYKAVTTQWLGKEKVASIRFDIVLLEKK